jgi:hypothetical protein
LVSLGSRELYFDPFTIDVNWLGLDGLVSATTAHRKGNESEASTPLSILIHHDNCYTASAQAERNTA